jgi:hypothetical protein
MHERKIKKLLQMFFKSKSCTELKPKIDIKTANAPSKYGQAFLYNCMEFNESPFFKSCQALKLCWQTKYKENAAINGKNNPINNIRAN